MYHWLRGLFLLRCAWWRITHPLTFGVKALVLTASGKVLLVRHGYKPGWHLPGGKLEKRETIEEAAKRELFEETGVSLDGHAGRLLGTYSNLQANCSDHISVFVFERVGESTPKPKPPEIEAAQFFALDNLPPDISAGNKRRIEEAIGKRGPQVCW